MTWTPITNLVIPCFREIGREFFPAKKILIPETAYMQAI